VDREARPVTVHRLEVDPASEPGVYRIEVDCSSGTYIRSLAADLGVALGGGAHLRRLRRTAVGSFTAEGAVALEEAGPVNVLPPAAAVSHLPSVAADPEAVRVGKVLDVDWPGDGPWAVLHEGHLLAVYERYGEGRAKPAVVVAQ
jgi:tRNA pseudouridine55 synthase